MLESNKEEEEEDITPPLTLRANRLFLVTLICTTRRRNPASARTKQGPENGGLIALGRLVGDIPSPYHFGCKVEESGFRV